MAKLVEPRRYLSQPDINMRLAGTVIRYKGKVVWVAECLGDMTLLVRNPKSGEDAIVHSSDVELDISSPPLGYINYKDRAIYLMRSTKQSQRQGVYPKNLICFHLETQDVSHGIVISWGEMKHLADCINGVHPTIHTIFKKGWKTGAFHRNWAMHHVGNGLWTLYHKDTGVGVLNQLNRTVYIPQGFLSKTRMLELQECLGKGEEDSFYVSELKATA